MNRGIRIGFGRGSNFPMIADMGVYLYTGIDSTGFRVGKVMDGAGISFGITGQSATLKYTRAVAANVGAYTLTGQPAVLTGPSVQGSSGQLAWTASTGSPTGYRVYYGTQPRVYTQARGSGINVGNATVWTPTGLSVGTRYYLAVTAYNATQESAYSDEVTKIG